VNEKCGWPVGGRGAVEMWPVASEASLILRAHAILSKRKNVFVLFSRAGSGPSKLPFAGSGCKSDSFCTAGKDCHNRIKKSYNCHKHVDIISSRENGLELET
jgi:hypothetical protein